MDVELFRFINETMSNPFFDQFFPWWTNLLKTSTFHFFLLPILLVAIFYFARWRGIAVLALGALLTWAADAVCGFGIKSLFNRQRPFEVLSDVIVRIPKPGSSSFPSGHSFDAFFFAMFLALIYPRLTWLYFTIALMFGFSRIYLGVHYPSDVLGGALFGCAFAYSVVTLYRFARTQEKTV